VARVPVPPLAQYTVHAAVTFPSPGTGRPLHASFRAPLPLLQQCQREAAPRHTSASTPALSKLVLSATTARTLFKLPQTSGIVPGDCYPISHPPREVHISWHVANLSDDGQSACGDVYITAPEPLSGLLRAELLEAGVQ